uniref:Uncharacterized protein n=1 Tax=Podoviridae sp. ctZkC8 TaxID=2825259 RepID=A0A8S5UBZ7_9CAUD|nr:MAG TPA: hypothetical protein [Podoviridae sp. ctZkC8]
MIGSISVHSPRKCICLFVLHFIRIHCNNHYMLTILYQYI